ncbi:MULTISPECIES: NAD-dependent epimerase/dehydratase family protein [Burkholderia]|uniref:NAD-dependent epimerase/dehydratase family protein n=1 Tax=Burkholderia TaxID=32008 RepID=UPI000B7A3F87|nr:MULTISPECIES: NAD-dependent epimerase/dehydratase family protein [Burkholderia]MBY4722337.1 NAD-dependent epimerase/dehydratase family protein [Burkholderia contaminans]MCI3971420.1 NAD-dependent epimerase/dehydratase family protein [Burkholderia sp. HI4860]MDN7786572.1 NAD-dependent epimerase/dehydratase family protein [Burkholderia contaminans]OXJ03879.1 GDP-mannose 4,6 dehydratase [Burkholderia sp. AU33647]
MASILVTGATGFVGRHLVHQLRELGHTVVGTTTRGGDGAEVCDLRDRDRVHEVVRAADPDVVIHLAALSSVTQGATLEYYETNLVGTENLMQAVDSLGSRRRFIFVSTAGVYGNQKTSLLSEDLAPLPVSHYGISKFACERVVSNFGDRHDITIARPFNLIGVGQSSSFIVPKLVRHFARREPSIRLGRLEPVRDYIDVHSCCDILASLIGQDASYGEVVNICSGRGTSVQELLDVIADICGHKIEVVAAPEFMRANEVFRLLGSTEKLDRLLPDRRPLQPITDVMREMLVAATEEGLR